MSTLHTQSIAIKEISLGDVISEYVKTPSTSYDINPAMMFKTIPEYIEVKLPAATVKLTLEAVFLKSITNDDSVGFVSYKTEVNIDYANGGSVGSTFGIGRRMKIDNNDLSAIRYIPMSSYGMFRRHINEQAIAILGEVIDACLCIEIPAVPKYIFNEPSGVDEHKLAVGLGLLQTGWFDRYLDSDNENNCYTVGAIGTIYHDREDGVAAYNIKRHFKLPEDRRVLITTEVGAIQKHDLGSEGHINQVWVNTKTNVSGNFVATPPKSFLDQLTVIKIKGITNE